MQVMKNCVNSVLKTKLLKMTSRYIVIIVTFHNIIVSTVSLLTLTNTPVVKNKSKVQ